VDGGRKRGTGEVQYEPFIVMRRRTTHHFKLLRRHEESKRGRGLLSGNNLRSSSRIKQGKRWLRKKESWRILYSIRIEGGEGVTISKRGDSF